MANHQSGYLQRAKKMQEIDSLYYSPYHDSCHKRVWSKHVYPIYGYSYQTFLKYLKVDTTPPPAEGNQLSLF